MCGRYQFEDGEGIEEIGRILNEINTNYQGTGLAAKTGEIFPTNLAPVLSMIDNKASLSIMKWGFPKWDGKGAIINAKSETANTKRTFAKSLSEKRCVIPSTGFFEWKQIEGKKTKEKFLFNTDESPMLYMAGLYNAFENGNQTFEHFVILTRDANNYINDVHNRMPVVLYKNELTDWLKDEQFVPFAFQRDNVPLVRKLA